MSSKPKRARRVLSPLGLALLAMLAFGALGANAAQAATWHVNGQTLQGTANISSKVDFGFTIPEWGLEVDCAHSQPAYSTVAEGGQMHLQTDVSECLVVGAEEVCEVWEPIHLDVSGTPAGLTHTGGGPLFYLSINGPECPFQMTNEGWGGSLAFSFGSEAFRLSTTISGSGSLGWNPVTYSGSGFLELASKWQTLGYW